MERILVVDDDKELCELVARIHAIGRRALPVEKTLEISQSRIALGDIVIDLVSRSVKQGDQNVKVTAVEFSLLYQQYQVLVHTLSVAGLAAAKILETGSVQDVLSYLRAVEKTDNNRIFLLKRITARSLVVCSPPGWIILLQPPANLTAFNTIYPKQRLPWLCLFPNRTGHSKAGHPDAWRQC